MIAPVRQEKICSKCYCPFPIESFRFSSKAKGVRHTVCRNCRRQRDQEQRAAKRQTALNRGLREVRRYSTVDKLWNLSQALIAQVGGLNSLLSLIRAQILSDETTPQRRISGGRALLHLVEIADGMKMRVLELEVEQLQEELRQVRREESPYDDVA